MYSPGLWASSYKHFIRRRADTERRLNVLYRNRFVLMHDVADNVFFFLPALYSQRQALVQECLIPDRVCDVAGKQAAARIGHYIARRGRNFYFHIRHLLANFLNLFQRQLAGRITRSAHLLPEHTVARFTALACTDGESALPGSAHDHQHNQPLDRTPISVGPISTTGFRSRIKVLSLALYAGTIFTTT